MGIAGNLLEQTERLQARLDKAKIKHLRNQNPQHASRSDALKDGLEVGLSAPTLGALPAIMAKRREIADFAFREPHERASILLRNIHEILADGTATLDESPAFRQNLPALRGYLVDAATLVASAEKAA